MPSISSFTDPKVYHILTYGTLLGSGIFQSFIGGVIAFKVLPRPQFSTLQQATFPVYFSIQTALPVIVALTFPGEKHEGLGLGGTAYRKFDGVIGLMDESNRWSALVPIGVMFATSALNLLLVGPATTRVMRERKHQETRDKVKYYEPGPKTPEMQRLNSSFSKLHGASSLLNLAGLFAMFYYGATLAEKL